MAGRLDVVATPIGNLNDLSVRARETLSAAELIAAEDTRRTGQMLNAIGVSGKLISLHDYNEHDRIAGLVDQLQAGRIIALVSDAGTPLLSDPGFALVRAAAAAGVEVRAIPGPSALTAALSVAGLPTDRFSFEGFPPSRHGERRAAFERLRHESRTLVFFEAPHRIASTLQDLAQILGEERSAVVARELTKMHETIYRGTLRGLCDRVGHDVDMTRGEITMIVAGAEKQGSDEGDRELLTRALQLLLPELPPARAAAIASQLAGCKRSDAYELALRMRSDLKSSNSD